MVDVLYLLGRDPALALVGDAARALAPGGSLVVKEIDVRPRWKYELARAQEVVSTRVTRITQGAGVAFVPPDDIVAAMSGAGPDGRPDPAGPRCAPPPPAARWAGARPTVAERASASPGAPDLGAPASQLDDEYFDVMATQAQVHWWYRARAGPGGRPAVRAARPRPPA